MTDFALTAAAEPVNVPASGSSAGDALSTLFRPAIRALAGYTPGEQPQTPGWTKLNTNELPYPPSPRAVEAMREAAGERLRIYPDPLGREFCRAVADRYGVTADMVLPGNGSDDCLTVLVRSFLDPQDTLALPYPSYILYETLAAIQGCRSRRIELNEDWSFDLDEARRIASDAKLLFVPNPNSPSGTVWDDETILSLVPPQGLLVLDEAYVDFRTELGDDGGDAAGFRGFKILERPEARRVVVTRTLSKSAGLAGLRLGYAVAHPELIAGMRKVKDSYNCDAVSLAGGAAAVRDVAYAEEVRGRVVATRTRMTEALRAMGFNCPDSQANFVWAVHHSGDHTRIYEALKQRRILVRNMLYAGERRTVGGLRMSVGTDAEADRLLAALQEVLA